jgi:hypothetical protein
MREMLNICVTIPKTFKRNYVSPDITLMYHPFEIQNIFKMCTGVYPTFLCFVLSCDSLASIDMDILIKEMMDYNIPSDSQWKEIMRLGMTKCSFPGTNK